MSGSGAWLRPAASRSGEYAKSSTSNLAFTGWLQLWTKLYPSAVFLLGWANYQDEEDKGFKPLQLYEGFLTIADGGFLISEIK